MRDVIWTIIIVWLVYRIYAAFSNRKTVVFQKHEHHHYEKEATVVNTEENNTKKSSKKIDDSEYVDFEEIK